jgi:hypothetical protein
MGNKFATYETLVDKRHPNHIDGVQCGIQRACTDQIQPSPPTLLCQYLVNHCFTFRSTLVASHLREIRWYFSFYDCLISLNATSFSFVHVTINDRISLFFSGHVYLGSYKICYIWKSIYCLRFGEFSVIILLNRFSMVLRFFSLPLRILKIHIFIHLTVALIWATSGSHL